MGKMKLLLLIAVVGVGLVSCSSSNDFAKVKYLDKTFAKKVKAKHQHEKFNYEESVNIPESVPDISGPEEAEANVPEPEIKNNEEKVIGNSLSTALLKAGNKEKAVEIPVPALSLDEVFTAVKPGTNVKNTSGVSGIAGLSGLTVVATILLVILSFFIPPLAVFLKRGADQHFWINLILFLLWAFALVGFPWLFPIAIIHALLVVLDVID